MKYRKDIQILRGVSVLLVVLFHLEIGKFSSGFLGVDVFFVISGYLMAVLYDPARKMQFFTNRAKRLLPLYFVVIMGTLAFCLAFTTPNEYNRVAQQAYFATAFSSNIGYWLQNSYFSKSAFNPLLHLWSLGVEIQFYLFVPLLFWIFKKFRKSYFLLLFGSLAACFVVVGISPKTSFFMMPLRLWEFLMGYGIASHMSKGVDAKNPALGWLGAACFVVLISVPMIPVDGEALGFMRGHPGIFAMIMCIATTVILRVGLPPAMESLRISSALETLGKYSYSIYLVHFPIIVLFLYQPFSGTILKANSSGQTLVLLSLITVFSISMHHLIESRCRSDGKALQPLLGFAISILVLCPMGVKFSELRFPEREMMIYRALTDVAVYRCGKVSRLIYPTAISCEITDPLKNPTHRILLVGNSHADSIKTTFATIASSKNVSVRFMVENNPLMDGGINPSGLINEAQSKSVDQIVLHYSPESIKTSTIEQVTALAKGLGITVSFIMPIPVWRENIPMALWKNMKQYEALPSATMSDYQSFNAHLSEELTKIGQNNLKVYPVAEHFCNDVCKIVSISGKPLYFDESHLTLTGSELLREVFEQIVARDSLHGTD
jgi:peptidoglycan/LPS O-acetylase OafA/YrhL